MTVFVDDEEKRRAQEREAARRYREKNREAIRARARARYAADPAKHKEKHRRWYQKAKNCPAFMEKQRLYGRRSYLPRRAQELLSLTGSTRPDVCCVCGEAGKICADHCHAKGDFRGWLCNRCNLVLGHVKDDPDLLRRLASYLTGANSPRSLVTP